MSAPTVCHCGSGKLPGIYVPGDKGWTWHCGVCHNDFKRCKGDD